MLMVKLIGFFSSVGVAGVVVMACSLKDSDYV